MNEEADRQYNGEFRYVNLVPAQVRKRLESEQDPDERAALMTAFRFWERQRLDRGVSAGQPDFGEPREAVYVESMAALAAQVKPVDHVFVGPCLRAGGVPSEGLTEGPCRGDIFDWDMLMSDGD